MRRFLIGLLVLPVLSCAGLGQESYIISDEQEIEMGQQYHVELLKEMPEYQGDARIGEYIKAMGAEIAAQSDRPTLAYTFTVVASEEINAFAVMGGYVYVTMGLLRHASSGAEIATIIAHEVGHVSARHGVRSMEIYVLAQGLSELVSSGQWGELISATIQTGTGLVFSQDQEREADSLGVKYAFKSQYNPWGMVDFFTYLQTLESSSTSTGIDATLGELFSTHPPTTERITNAQTELAEMGVSRDTSTLRWDSATPFSEIAAILPVATTSR